MPRLKLKECRDFFQESRVSQECTVLAENLELRSNLDKQHTYFVQSFQYDT